jgi:hypothetical protein
MNLLNNALNIEKPLYLNLKIDNQTLKMELDNWACLSVIRVISMTTYTKYFQSKIVRKISNK